MEKTTVVVNLLAGPGAGKTTCAWAIASELKKRGIETEYVSEYAKELVWDGNLTMLDGSYQHQRALFEEQDRRVKRLLGKVDVVVTDSPALLSLMYIKEPNREFTQTVLERFTNQQNFNLFINRGKDYQQTGRLQTLEESIAIDNSIKGFLKENNIYYGTYYHHTLDVLVDNIIKNFNKVNAKTNVNKSISTPQASEGDNTIIVDPDKGISLKANDKECLEFINQHGLGSVIVLSAYEEGTDYPMDERYVARVTNPLGYEMQTPPTAYIPLSSRFTMALGTLHITPEQVEYVAENYTHEQLVEYVKNETTRTVDTNRGKIPIQEYREMISSQYGYDSYEELYKAGGRLGDELDIQPLVPGDSKALAGTDENIYTVDLEEDRFFVYPEKQTVVWLYYNPDSISNGQFVRNTLQFSDIEKAASLYRDPGMFFDYLGQACRQELIDQGDTLFPIAEKEFCSPPHFTNCNFNTMENLIKTASNDILYDTNITPMDELNHRIKTIAATYEDSPETIAELLAFKARFYQYSPKNTMLIYAENPRATFVGSFNKFKELGYSVKKGEHGMKVFVPAEVTLFRENPKEEWVAISKATKKQKEAIKNNQYETKKILTFKVGTVFDIAQTTCPVEDLPKYFSFGVESIQHKEICDRLAEFSKKELGCPITDEDLKTIAVLGQYVPATNSIQLNNRMEDTQRLSTLTHELGHAIMQHRVGEKPRVQIELEADAFSIMLNSRLGIELTDSRKSHLAGHYKLLQEYNSNLTDKKDVISLDTIIANCSKVYGENIPKIEKYLFPAEPLQDVGAIPYETLKGSVKNPATDLQFIILDKRTYSAIQPELSTLKHSVLEKDGKTNVAFYSEDTKKVLDMVTAHQDTPVLQHQTNQMKGGKHL